MRNCHLLILFPLLLSAETVLQTDWSGGDGVLGPVSDWGNDFYSSTDVLWLQVPYRISIMLIGEYQITNNCMEVFSTASADIDNDGDTDVIATDAAHDEVYWYENLDSLGTDWIKHKIGDNMNWPIWVNAIDMNQDGHIDVVCSDYGRENIWYENDDGSGSSWTEHEISETSTGRNIYSVDMDGDGDIDVLTSNICWFENVDGYGIQWVGHSVGEGCRAVHAEDIDGDGDLDVASAYYHYEHDIVWWENSDGIGTSWIQHLVDDDFDRGHSVFCTDLNDDGYMDIVGGAAYGGGVAWWENTDGSGNNWEKHAIQSGYTKSLFCDDMDDDADMDVIATFSGKIYWFENVDGSGYVWNMNTVSNYFPDAVCVTTDDFNGDGNTDILAAAREENIVAWWDITDISDVGVLESSILEIPMNPDYKYISWSTFEPESTQVGFQLRVSDDPNNMGAWSDTLWAPDSLNGIISDEKDFIQYRAIMMVEDVQISPIIYTVGIDWEPHTLIEEQGNSWEYELLGSLPNPSSNEPTVYFSVPEATLVEMTLYDLSGRIVSSTYSSFAAGSHKITVDELPSGVYLVRMRSNEFVSSKLFSVLN